MAESSSIAFLKWYLSTTLLGWSSFPLLFYLFPNLKERGFAMHRAFALLVWGYIFWLLASLGILLNNLAGLLIAWLILLASSAWSMRSERWREMLLWIKANTRTLLTIEALFLFAFLFWAIVRAANPEAIGTEKPMELAFINAILRSDTFPPHDPWLSGYAISYYYFGYVIVAMLAKLNATSGGVAFNLALSLIFALSANGAYGILFNLLSQNKERAESVRKAAFLGPFFVLLVGNLEGFLDVLHQRGFFWKPTNEGGLSSPFWRWLDIQDLNLPPTQPFSWVPQRFWWWWRASRVLQDYDLAGNTKEIIDEFPFFSFLLGDLHPHVLAIPFAFLAILLALNLILGGAKGHGISKHYTLKATQIRNMGWLCSLSGMGLFSYGALRLSFSSLALGLVGLFIGILLLFRTFSAKKEAESFELHLKISIQGVDFFLACLILGGLAFLNTWDFPFYVTLYAGAYALRECQQRQARLIDAFKDFILMALALGIGGVMLYLPFYLGFASQAGGIIPNLVYVTRGAHLWVMFFPLLVPLVLHLVFHPGSRISRKRALMTSLSIFVILSIASLFFGSIIMLIPQAGDFFIRSLGALHAEEVMRAFLSRRIAYIGGWFTLFILASLTLNVWFYAEERWRQNEYPAGISNEATQRKDEQAQLFVALLVILGTMLVLIPEFFYLRDQFGWRMNTIFKFYYQAWLLWSLAAAYATHHAWGRLTGWKGSLVRITLSAMLAMSLVYPILSLWNKTNGFQPSKWTLDSSVYFSSQSPDEFAAIEWLRHTPMGVVAEAVAETGGSYTHYARVSMLSGLPAVLGWVGHESQWRGGGREIGTRQPDLERLYCTRDWNEAESILRKYHIRYIFVSALERSTYRPKPGSCPVGLVETKFAQHLTLVFQQGSVTIYEYILPDEKP